MTCNGKRPQAESSVGSLALAATASLIVRVATLAGGAREEIPPPTAQKSNPNNSFSRV